jgi:enoyl-CoA hydratase/carnithine racemase
MPGELEAAVADAIRDGDVKVIVLRGAGRTFCAGSDFGSGFHHSDEGRPGEATPIRAKQRRARGLVSARSVGECP